MKILKVIKTIKNTILMKMKKKKKWKNNRIWKRIWKHLKIELGENKNKKLNIRKNKEIEKSEI